MTALAVLALNHVYHVGTMCRRDARAWSLEGDALSVSWCPDAWTQIARLGGRPTWRLSRDGGRFVDLTLTAARARASIDDWAQAKRLLVRTDLWRVNYYDSELGRDAYTEHTTKAEALDAGENVSRVRSWRGTDALRNAVGFRAEATGELARDLAAMAWAERYDFDGVWWREVYDPDRYSAPRGLLFQSKVAAWSRAIVSTPDDGLLLARFPSARREPSTLAIQPAGLVVG